MVSRGIQLTTNGFGLSISQLGWPSSGTQPFTITFWFNINSLNPGLEGTTLISILSAGDGWPMNNWGYYWCDILPDNRIKTVIRSTGATGSTLEVNDFEFTPGTWYHMACVMDYNSGRTLTIYINGKQVGTLNCASPYTWQSSYYMFIGGAFANRSALAANLDEFQLYNKALTAEEVTASMNHFTQDELPSSLIGYWDFETEPEADNTLMSVGTNKSLYAGMYEIVSTEENVVTYEPKEFAYTTGAPFISGEIYEIKTIPTWSLKGASVLSASGDCAAGEATVSYANEGQYTATLKLENGWGSATKEFSYVNVSASSGIEEVSVAEMQAFPNPFVDEVYVRFAEEGVYTIAVYDASGRQTGSSQVDAAAGEMINIPVTGASGVYYMKVYSGDTLLKAMKVIKK